jgi:hypothetical protein
MWTVPKVTTCGSHPLVYVPYLKVCTYKSNRCKPSNSYMDAHPFSHSKHKDILLCIFFITPCKVCKLFFSKWVAMGTTLLPHQTTTLSFHSRLHHPDFRASLVKHVQHHVPSTEELLQRPICHAHPCPCTICSLLMLLHV